eukprot:TRINITY_DN7007_c0_g1_i1.p1 TRINITY_DN7007_c0_g1~~TRINITY_DN7007_c0_g1_i1.p1  ORF type:complete len:352 (-),score=73.81 TRINITY_DN7007_c0_g1_i1:150-1205(-)
MMADEFILSLPPSPGSSTFVDALLGQEDFERLRTKTEQLNEGDSDQISFVRKRILRRVSKACLACKKGHVSCDNERPCRRCKEKEIDCQDGEIKKRGRKKRDEDDMSSVLTLKMEPAMPPDYASLEDFLLWSKTGSVEDLPSALRSFSLPEQNNKKLKLQTPSAIANTFADIEFIKEFEDKILIPRAPDLQLFVKGMLEVESCLNALTPPERALMLKADIEATLKTLIPTFDAMNCAVLIWDKDLVIHYTNQEYKQATGFNEKVPTNPTDFAFARQLSIHGLRQYILGKCLSEQPERTSWTFPCGIRMWNQPEGSYLDGILNITLKMGSMGFPILFLGVFLPFSGQETSAF